MKTTTLVLAIWAVAVLFVIMVLAIDQDQDEVCKRCSYSCSGDSKSIQCECEDGRRWVIKCDK